MVAVASSSAGPRGRARRPASAGTGPRRSRPPARTGGGRRCRPASASISGSTRRTEAPECSTMYSISAGASRKLIGTRMRPQPHTPKNEVSSRDELWETMATRSPAARRPAGPGPRPGPVPGRPARRTSAAPTARPAGRARRRARSAPDTAISARSRKSRTLKCNDHRSPRSVRTCHRHAAGHPLKWHRSASRMARGPGRPTGPGGGHADAVEGTGAARTPSRSGR